MSIPVYTEYIYTLWGRSSSDIFALGEDENSGVVLHYNGNTWSEVPLNTGEYEYYISVWGVPGKYFFVKYLEFSSQNDESTIVECDGQDWSESQTVVPGSYHDIWGSSPNDIFAVGYDETPEGYQSRILHFDGENWTEAEEGFPISLRSVWGSSSTDVFAVGSDTILHYDGVSWSVMEENLPYSLHAVWGASEESVFVAGSSGILRYNGTRWAEVSDKGSWDIWVSPDSEVFISGVEEPVVYSDGSSWISMCNIDYEVKNQREYYYGVWGTTREDVFIAGSKGRPQSASRGMILRSNFKKDLNCLCE